MPIKIYPSTELRNHTKEILREVCKEPDACYITVHGKAEAVLLSVDQYNHIMSELEDRFDEQDPELLREVKEAMRDYHAGKGIPFREWLKSRTKKLNSKKS